MSKRLVSDFEKYEAIAALLEELDDILEPTPYGFSKKASVWVDGVKRSLEFCLEELAQRNE